MDRFRLRHPTGETTLIVARGAEVLTEGLAPVSGRTVCLLAAEPVWRLHGDAVEAAIESAGGRLRHLAVPDGERAKSAAVVADVWREMLDAGLRRDDCVVTFGGGSTGDLGGFAAGTYMRGIDLIQIPTTVIAQVDASLGGKTAINVGETKNSIGVFHHPLAVVAVTGFLETLPTRQLASGLVEVIKMASLLDLELLELVEARLSGLLAGDAGEWAEVVARSQRAKAAVVERDPRDGDERRVLNFGHTLGHALELGCPPGWLTHGEAVAHGMRFALDLAERRGLEPAMAQRLTALLDRLPIPPLPRLDPAALHGRIGRDKKASRAGVVWVLPAGDRGWRAEVVEPAEIAAALDRFVANGATPC